MMALRLSLLASIATLGFFSCAGAALGAPAPVWNLDIEHNQTNFPPGGTGEYWINADNIGSAATSGPVTLTFELPPGMTRESVRTSGDFAYLFDPVGWECPGSPGATEIVCTTSSSFHRHTPNRELIFTVNVPAGAEGDVLASARIEGGGAAPAVAVEPTRISAEEAGFGLVPASFVPDFFQADGRTAEREAGAHPDLLSIPVDANTIAGPVPDQPSQKVAAGSLRDLELDLPPGTVIDPSAVGECTPGELTWGLCSPSSQVGRIDLRTYPLLPPLPAQSYSAFSTGVFNLAHPRGTIADFAFQILNNPAHFRVSLDPANRYAIRLSVLATNETRPLYSQKLTFWGVPAESSHDSERCHKFTSNLLPGIGGNTEDECPTEAIPKPFLTQPSQCETDNTMRLRHYDSWQQIGVFGPEIDYTLPGRMTGCAKPRFEPAVDIVPTGKQANAPTGLDVHVKIAQNENPNALATPPVKRFTVKLPQGMSFSPSFADGLRGCSLDQIGLETNDPVGCPDASRIGEVSLHTPLLPRALEGSMYVATQGDNPFGSLFALYLVLHDTEERGVLVKMPGRIDVDPNTGRIVVVFDEAPQFPYDDLTLKFRNGPRAPLVSPPSCGTQTIGVEVASYAQPQNPVDASNTYDVSEGPGGTPCPPDPAKRPFSPRFDAGSLSPVAGAYSTFLFRLARDDSEQELSQVATTFPKGLLAKIAGVPVCPAQAIESISAAVGSGTRELAHPACPAASQIGTISAGMGAGPGPNYFDGKVYLGGPYKGAPLSLAVVVPALAGPFDLGSVVVRAALYVDPGTTQVRVVTDPFPQILHGVILRVRDVRLRIDRSRTTVNPTSCSPTSVGGQITGAGGDPFSTTDDLLYSATVPFQVGSCRDLSFKPKLSLRLDGGTRRGAHPSLRTSLRMPGGGANIARASVVLPDSEFLDQSHIGTVCTREQFAADACPPASVYGSAAADSPLLGETLRGKVYLRSSNHTLPDLVAVLEGRVKIDLVGRIGSVGGGIQTSFAAVPDAAIDGFRLTLAGGRRGLLVNSANLCRAVTTTTAKFIAHSGKRAVLRPELKSSCVGAGPRGPRARQR